MVDCNLCGGNGFTVVDDGIAGPPVTQVCVCVLRRQYHANLERGMRGLTAADRLEPGTVSPLRHHTRRDLRVTGSAPWFASHLRHTAIRKQVDWGFRVVTDADLMVAWLATAALQGTEILDPDARSKAAPVSLTKLTLVDISEPPDLLIIRLGVKAARNSAMPEVLHEALAIRAHAAKPTWMWDQPDAPFDQSHLAFSRLVEEFTGGWHRVYESDVPEYAEDPIPSTATAPRRVPPGRPKPKPTGSGGSGGNGGSGGTSVRDMLLGNSGGSKR